MKLNKPLLEELDTEIIFYGEQTKINNVPCYDIIENEKLNNGSFYECQIRFVFFCNGDVLKEKLYFGVDILKKIEITYFIEEYEETQSLEAELVADMGYLLKTSFVENNQMIIQEDGVIAFQDMCIETIRRILDYNDLEDFAEEFITFSQLRSTSTVLTHKKDE